VAQLGFTVRGSFGAALPNHFCLLFIILTPKRHLDLNISFIYLYGMMDEESKRYRQLQSATMTRTMMQMHLQWYTENEQTFQLQQQWVRLCTLVTQLTADYCW